jgi:hypothetical protein
MALVGILWEISLCTKEQISITRFVAEFIQFTSAGAGEPVQF